MLSPAKLRQTPYLLPSGPNTITTCVSGLYVSTISNISNSFPRCVCLSFLVRYAWLHWYRQNIAGGEGASGYSQSDKDLDSCDESDALHWAAESKTLSE